VANFRLRKCTEARLRKPSVPASPADNSLKTPRGEYDCTLNRCWAHVERLHLGLWRENWVEIGGLLDERPDEDRLPTRMLEFLTDPTPP
jgi:hypothetical protein